jgi:trehalose 6-phosphate synthase/phosphatase
MVNQLRAPSLPTEHLIESLKELCSDKRNHVFVVSGKERHSLVKALGRVPNLGLAAEHGMFISWPTKKSKRSWETIVPETDRSWRSLAITIMEVYTSRTHGSYIEETEMKVLWQYRDADPEFGYLQSRELEDHLVNVLRGYAVEVLHGGIEEGGYVEVRPLGVNKGVLALHVLQKLPKKVDFALCIGDDHCDEPMLSVMRQAGRRVLESKLSRQGKPPLPPLPATVTLVDVSSCDDHVSSDLEVFTATVGKKPSAAANFLNDVDESFELLDILNKMNARDQRYFSSVDLRSMESKKGRFGAGPAQVGSNGGGLGGVTMSLTAENPSAMGGGFKRSVSLGTMHRDGGAKKNVSASLQQFLGAIEDEEEEDAVFF